MNKVHIWGARLALTDYLFLQVVVGSGEISERSQTTSEQLRAELGKTHPVIFYFFSAENDVYNVILFCRAEILIIQRNKHLLLQILSLWIREVLMDVYLYQLGLHPELGTTVL